VRRRRPPKPWPTSDAYIAPGVLPLEFKPVYSVGDQLPQHLDELEQEAERKGGVLQSLTAHFTKVYRVPLPLAV
jgi:hypothetical protein